jgi:hypothetical protein
MAILTFTENTVILNLDRYHKASYDKDDSVEHGSNWNEHE